MTSKRPDLRLLPDPEFPLLGGADDWIYNAAAAPGADDWEPMADGYHQAAEIVAEHLAERPGFRGYSGAISGKRKPNSISAGSR